MGKRFGPQNIPPPIVTRSLETEPMECDICCEPTEYILATKGLPAICSDACEAMFLIKRKKRHRFKVHREKSHRFRVHRGPYPSKLYGCDLCGVAEENHGLIGTADEFPGRVKLMVIDDRQRVFEELCPFLGPERRCNVNQTSKPLCVSTKSEGCLLRQYDRFVVERVDGPASR